VNSNAQAIAKLRRPLCQLENKHGSDRGGNGQKPLREARDKINLVGHVHFSVD
jgi:hypothetical protein